MHYNITQTGDQDGYDFFTSAIEDDLSSFIRHPPPPPPPQPTTAGGEGSPLEHTDGETVEDQQDEMDTSALLEQVWIDVAVCVSVIKVYL